VIFSTLNFYCLCCLLKVKACSPLKDETTKVFCLCSYGLQIDTIRLDFKSGLETLLKDKPIRAIFLGVRIGDPTAVSLVFNLDIPSFCICFELLIFWSGLHPHVLWHTYMLWGENEAAYSLLSYLQSSIY
jgi:hypothetical protein